MESPENDLWLPPQEEVIHETCTNNNKGWISNRGTSFIYKIHFI